MFKILSLKPSRAEFLYYSNSRVSRKHWATSYQQNHRLCNTSEAVREEDDLDPKYDAKKVVANRYSWWKDRNLFTPSRGDGENSFSLLLPPPNVTGTLHLGHALTATIQDVLVKWHRMQGEDVLWIPGTDHAGIATQVIVERNIEKLGMTRHFLGKEKFLSEVVKWQKKHSGVIDAQLKELGCSLHWKQYYFTMDEKRKYAVEEAFIRLFNSNLIYRKRSLINWCCHLESTISDIEVDQKSLSGKTALTLPGYDQPVEFGILTKIAYKVYNKDDEVVVATTRPETVFADVAVAVHPKDERYSHLRDAQLWHPYRKVKIPVIFDERVDPEFGTGAVKITPGHSFADYEISVGHNLELLTCISEKGTMTDLCGNYAGLKRFRARELLLEDMARRNILRDVGGHAMVLPMCSRSGDVLEVLMKPQWFIKTEKMAKEALRAVQSKQLVLEPERYKQEWKRWLKENRDWCISRQLWWGHQIPVFREVGDEREDSTWVAARDDTEAKRLLSELKGSEVSQVHQDQDVLDTWFSSALLPFSSLGWPEKTEELERYYPLSMMITGHDILFFWAARMVMLGKELTGVLPFKKILLHGVICDSRGKKMSKSLGNVITPENIIEGVSLQALTRRVDAAVMGCFISDEEGNETKKLQREQFPLGIPACGVDALRLSLCSQNIHNMYLSFNLPTYQTNLFFCNKVWQACRFYRGIMNNRNVSTEKPDLKQVNLSTMDHWILSRLASLVLSVNSNLQNARLDECISDLQVFFRDQLCDNYIEGCKTRLDTSAEVSGDKLAMRATLSTCINTFLVLLSPFAPHLAEALFQEMPWRDENYESILSVPYPQPAEWKNWINRPLEEEFDVVIKIISAIREIKKRSGVGFRDECSVILETSRRRLERYIPEAAGLFQKLTNSNITKVIRKPNVEVTILSPTDTLVNNEVLVRVNINPKDLKRGAHERHEKLMGLYRKEAKLVKALDQLESRLKEGISRGKVFNDNHHLCMKSAKISAELKSVRDEIDVSVQDITDKGETLPTRSEALAKVSAKASAQEEEILKEEVTENKTRRRETESA